MLALARHLADGPLADCRVGVLHGQLPSEAKDAVMSSFAAGEIDVLVATTVIEVGVDVANASVMVVMDADRFGVSQLHQIRGRVGRGDVAGLCLLVTELPDASPARERLARGRRHHRRLRPGADRPRAAPGGRRPRRLAVGRPVQPEGAACGLRRGRSSSRARGDAVALVARRPRPADAP